MNRGSLYYQFGSECPFCENGVPKLNIENNTLSYRGKLVCYQHNNYLCSFCKQAFTTTELDEINIDNIKSSHRDNKLNEILK